MIQYKKGEPIIWFDNVNMGYGDNVVLKDINIIEHDLIVEGKITGQSICFVGRSGRGKSTLFKVLSGLMSPLTGKVVLNFGEVNRLVKEGDVGLVDQKYTLFRHKTVFDTLMFSMRKLSVENKKEIIEESLSQWNLLPHKDKYPNELSGGQRQRVSILEKLLSSNHYIIMDEPISGLDVVAIDNVKDNFKKILSTHEKNTIIFSTHDIDFAIEMADVIYVIGHKEPTDTHSTIVNRYNMLDLTERSSIKNNLIDDLKNS